MNIPTTELKKKMRSLSGGYRRERFREKQSRITGSGTEDTYKSKWFAYDEFAFMADKNDPGTTRDTLQLESLIVDDSEQESDHGTESFFATFRESTEEQLIECPRSLETHTERPLTRESTGRKRKEQNADPLSDTSPVSKKERQYPTAQKQDIGETHFHNNLDKSNCCDKEEMVNVIAECNLYGQLLAEKMKPLDADDRLVLMNEIDNLVFKHLMNIRKRNKPVRSARLSSTNQTYLDTRQSIDLPGPSQTQEASQNVQDSQYGIPMPFRLKTEAESPQ
ncbi:hypothetical protein PYW07_014782 [Mythimna separata]|uniref:Uncharacterized protein n=1 Tax=Mythimna separata TaxID=271217 RepID=A0AAD8E0G5_MYTSE|nr:hypothetical protein PYW07_014782 [Mythimna separata]